MVRQNVLLLYHLQFRVTMFQTMWARLWLAVVLNW